MKKLLLVSFLALGIISGCNNGGAPPPPATTVAVAPPTATVQAGGTQQFTATVTNASNTAVTWTLSGTGCTGAACGTLSSTTANPVTYTAPATPPASNLTVTITATSAADTSKSGSATITVPAITVSVAPATATVLAGNTQSFTATVSNTPNVAVTWTLSGTGCTGTGCGTLSSTTANPVTYTAPAPPASNLTVTIKATSVADNTKSGSATITVPAITVAVAPASANVPVRGTQQFTATVSNGAGAQSVTWTLTQGVNPCSPTCGTIAPATTTSGTPTTYTAPGAVPTNPMVTITATSVTDTTKFATATATVVGITVSVSPTTASVAVNATQQFIATVANDVMSSGVAWTLTQAGTACSPGCGTIAPPMTASGAPTTYTAPTTVPTPAMVTVTATSVADPTKLASATVTVTPPPPISVSVAPTTASVTVNTTQQFTATVTNDPASAGVTWTLTQGGTACSPSCGTVAPTSTASGTPTTYTAPGAVPTNPAVTITATSVTDSTKSAFATITVTAATLSKLNGPYAFVFNGFDAGGLVAIAGSFTADGSGNITGGLQDVNRTSGVTTSQAFTGTYTVGTDNRGSMTLMAPPVGQTLTFQFALSGFVTGVATRARFIAFDNAPPGIPTIRGSGVMEQQDPTAFSTTQISGDFAFGGSGADAMGRRFGVVGRFTAAGGTITMGAFDTNTAGTVVPNIPFTATYMVASTGRGTLQITTQTVPSLTFNDSFYVVSSSELLFVSTDARTIGISAASGQVLKQSPSPATFTNASLSGTAVLFTTALGGGGASRAEAGQLTFNPTTGACGTFTPPCFNLAFDENRGGTINSNGTDNGTYSVATNGRATTSGGNHPATVYLVSQNKGFVLLTNNAVNIGFFELQTATSLPPANFAGSFGTVTPANVSGTDASGIVTLANGTMAGSTVTVTSDNSSPGSAVQLGQTILDTVALPVSSNGRVTFTSGNNVVWIVSQSKAVLINIQTSTTNPVVQIIDKQ